MSMKQLIFTLLTLALLAACTPSSTQEAGADPQVPEMVHRHHGHPIEEIVKDLSHEQKEQLRQIMSDSHDYIDSLRTLQDHIRDSINAINDQYGDHSSLIFPLYEREAELQVAINQAFYQNKIHLDSVLTEEQFTTFTTQMKERRRHDHHRGHGGNFDDRHHGPHDHHGPHHEH